MKTISTLRVVKLLSLGGLYHLLSTEQQLLSHVVFPINNN